MTDPEISVEWLDPNTVLLDANVRTDAMLTKDFIASVRQLGVLTPVVAVRTDDGQIYVRMGKRRTLAAIEAGRQLPVVVTTDDHADQVHRILSQLHENEHRSGMSTGDKVAAVEQLSLYGMSAAQIAKATPYRRPEVDQALTASRSTVAKGAAERYDFLTLDAASALAEFEGDTDTVKALVAAAKTSEGQFDHVLQRARDAREEAAQITALREQIAQDGTRLIERPEHGDRTVKNLTDLMTVAGKSIEAAEHVTCPGHAAYVTSGLHGVESVYVCTDWVAQGHRDRYSRRPAKGQMTERAWLSKFLARKAMPKGTLGYLAVELAHGGHALRRAFERAQPLAATLLGTDTNYTRQSVISLAEQAASDGRAGVIALGVVLSAIEDSTGPHTWANPSDTARRYFAFLAANGYVLSEVEQLAAGQDSKKGKPVRRARTRPVAVTEPVPNDGDTEDTATTEDATDGTTEASAAA
jgi:ParB family chromosome partitioning protein